MYSGSLGKARVALLVKLVQEVNSLEEENMVEG